MTRLPPLPFVDPLYCPLIRIDFSDDAKWNAFLAALNDQSFVYYGGENPPLVSIISDPIYDGASPLDLVDTLGEETLFFIVVDRFALDAPRNPVLHVPRDQYLMWFRTYARDLTKTTNLLMLGIMGWRDHHTFDEKGVLVHD